MSFLCVICRDLLSNNPRDEPEGASAVGHANIVVAAKCGYLYHLHCLIGWFTTNTNPRLECPYCKTVILNLQKIFPVGDEETEELNSLMNKVKEATKKSEKLEHQISQLDVKLSETGAKLKETTLALENLKSKYNLKSSELIQAQLAVSQDYENERRHILLYVLVIVFVGVLRIVIFCLSSCQNG